MHPIIARDVTHARVADLHHEAERTARSGTAPRR
jgi:hypothetical protein